MLHGAYCVSYATQNFSCYLICWIIFSYFKLRDAFVVTWVQFLLEAYSHFFMWELLNFICNAFRPMKYKNILYCLHYVFILFATENCMQAYWNWIKSFIFVKFLEESSGTYSFDDFEPRAYIIDNMHKAYQLTN